MKDVECDGKGVRKTHTDVSVMHVKKHESWGVRKENVHYEKSYNRSSRSLLLCGDKPCVCGSLKHSRTTHIRCVLNKQCDDVS